MTARLAADPYAAVARRHEKAGHHFEYDETIRDYACGCRLALAFAPLRAIDGVMWISDEHRNHGERRRLPA